VWASVDFAKGKSALNAGALDAYAVKMVRMRWNSIVNERSRIQWQGKTYQIVPETFNPDRQGNTIQFLCQQVINDK
jgi:head-tail adaptor